MGLDPSFSGRGLSPLWRVLLGSLLGLGGGLFVTPLLSGPLGLPIHQAVAASVVAVIATSSAGGSGYLPAKYSQRPAGDGYWRRELSWARLLARWWVVR